MGDQLWWACASLVTLRSIPYCTVGTGVTLLWKINSVFLSLRACRDDPACKTSSQRSSSCPDTQTPPTALPGPLNWSVVRPIVTASVIHGNGWTDCCREFARTISRPFELTYDPYTQRVTVIDGPESISRAVYDVRSQLDIVSSALRKLHVNWHVSDVIACRRKTIPLEVVPLRFSITEYLV